VVAETADSDPWPGIPIRGRNAAERAEVCWLPIADGLTPPVWSSITVEGVPSPTISVLYVCRRHSAPADRRADRAVAASRARTAPAPTRPSDPAHLLAHQGVGVAAEVDAAAFRGLGDDADNVCLLRGEGEHTLPPPPRVREAAGERFDQLELAALIWQVVVTDRPRSAAEDVAPRWGMTGDQVLASAYFLMGSLPAIVEQVQALRERHGHQLSGHLPE
jgi:hypothetical protein